MNFLAPAAFFLAGLLPIIILMYLLKLRRVEHLVSSIYPWQRMVRDMQANTPWQRLRRNLLLILQLLFLVALIFALARPFTWTEGLSGHAAILIIDTSASMAATDISPSRIQAAKQQAHQLVDQLPEDARVTVITAGNRVEVVASSSLDRRQVHQAIENAQTAATGSDLEVALQLASAIAARQSDAQVVVLSDGRSALPEHMTIKGGFRYLPIGLSADNQAISLLTVEPAPGGESLTVFVQVSNYGDQPAARRLAIYTDDQLFNAYDMDLPAGQTSSKLAENIPISTRLIEARLLPGQNAIDYLESDNRAYLPVRQAVPSKISLVTSGNLFLETALALLPGLETTRIAPEELSTFPEADLTIFDRYIPITTSLPAGNLLFIAPPQNTPYFTITGIVANPIPMPVAQDHPLLKHVSLDNVSILDTLNFAPSDWARPVIVARDSSMPGSEAPLLFAGESNGRRLAVIAFDLHHSDLPLQIAFPILLANLVHWLAPGEIANIPSQVEPGAAVSFPLPVASMSEQNSPDVTITRPDGSQVKLSNQDGKYVFADTTALGLYQIQIGNQETILFAVNLLKPQESALEPASTLPVTGTISNETGSASLQARYEWWRYLALLGLVLLVAEWFVYQRAALALLVYRLKKSWLLGRSLKTE